MKRPTTEQLDRLALLLQLTANTAAHTPALEHLTHALDTLAIAATLAALAPEPNTPVDDEQLHDETDDDQNRDMP